MTHSPLITPPREQKIRRLAQAYPNVDIGSIEAYLALRWMGGELDQAIEVHLGRHGLSTARFMVLAMIHDSGGQGVLPSAIAEYCRVKPATITGLIDGLEEASLVERSEHDSDRRATVIKLTRSGKSLIDRVLPEHFKRVSRLMKGLTPTEKKNLISILSKIAENTHTLRDP